MIPGPVLTDSARAPIGMKMPEQRQTLTMPPNPLISMDMVANDLLPGDPYYSLFL